MEYHFNPAVGHLRPGDHICLFYRSQEQLLATLVPYIRLGLERNEQCLSIQSAGANRRLIGALQAEGIAADYHLQRGAVLLINPEEGYLESGRFDPEAMKTMLSSRIRNCLHQGFAGLRAFGDMSWALEKNTGGNRLLEYETLMERFFPTKAALGLCGYPVNRFSAAKLRDVLTVHRCALLEGDHKGTRRTVRFQGGKYVGQVEFDAAAKGPFFCQIRHTSDTTLFSWRHEKSLATAIGSVKRELRQLRSRPH